MLKKRLLFCLALAGALAGCVPLGRYRRDVRDAEEHAYQKARAMAHRDHCDATVAAINKRLKAIDEQ